MSVRRYPLEPFLALTRWTFSDVQAVVPCNGGEWRKRKAFGVTELTADRIACAAGLAPLNVWPDFGHRPCEECGEPFPPTSPLRRFCGRNCQARNAGRRRYERDPVYRERARASARRYHDETAEYRRAQRRRRYWENAEKERAEARARYRRQRAELDPKTASDLLQYGEPGAAVTAPALAETGRRSRH